MICWNILISISMKCIGKFDICMIYFHIFSAKNYYNTIPYLVNLSYNKLEKISGLHELVLESRYLFQQFKAFSKRFARVHDHNYSVSMKIDSDMSFRFHRQMFHAFF